MRIKELDIVSFGKWNRKKMLLFDELNYFYGPNEAGKSTIRMFIIYILFGLKADEREQYISKVDGQLGGRLVVEIEKQLYVFERFLHKQKGQLSVTKDGEELERADVKMLLKGLDRPLFEAVFSFEDRDLQTIRQYKREDVGKVLFNLGLTGSDLITQLESQLIKNTDEIFKKQGKKPPLNEKLLELKKLQQDIQDAEQKEFKHQQLYQELDQLDQSLQKLKTDEQRLMNEISYFEKLKQVKSPIIKYQLLLDEVQSLSDVKDFPKDGLEQFNELQKEIKLQNEQINNLNTSIQNIEDDLLKVSSKSQLNNWSISLTEAQHLIQKITKQQDEVERLKEHLKVLEHEFKQVQGDLGVEMEIKDLKGITVNHYTNENWKRLASQWDQLKNHIQSLKLKIQHKNEDLERHQHQKQSIELQMLSNEEEHSLQERFDDLKLNEQKQLLEEQYRNQMKSQQNTIKKVNGFVSVSKWILPIMILVVTYMLMFREGLDFLTVYGGLAVGVVLSIIVFYILHQQHKNTRRTIKRLNSKPSNTMNHEEELNDLRQQLNFQQDLKQQVQQMDHYIKGVRSHLEELDKELNYAQKQFGSVEQSIEEEINSFPFMKRFELFHWPNVYDQLRKGKETATSYIKVKKQIHELMKYIENHIKELITIVHLYEPEKYVEDPNLICNMALNYVEQEKSWQHEIKQKNDWLSEQKTERHKLVTKKEQKDDELTQLLSSVGVSSEEEFKQKADRHLELIEKNKHLNDLYEMIFEVFNQETELVIHKNYDWLDIESRLNDITHRLNDLRENIEETRNQISETQAELKQLEENGVLSDLVHQKSILEAEILKLAKEFAIMKTAYGFLKDTKNRYQNVYLPGIMNKTSDYFSKLSDGRYMELKFNEDETILVKTTEGQWFNVQQLSEGTADQLYIALRFALNDSLKDYIDLPFILDDAFVHFDQKRKKQVLEIVKDISDKQQVLYLTCHPREQEYMNERPLQLHVS